MSIKTKIGVIYFVATSALCLSSITEAGVVEDAMADDMQSLCSDSPANELYKIANKKKNSDEMRRDALRLMVEVSRECSNVSSNRLTQYHHKIVNVAHKILDMPEVDSRQSAIECLQYVILLPDDQQPPQGSISRGQTIANVATGDSDANIRVWALEALVNLRGDDLIVQNTLISASSDSASIVRETATEMLNDMF